MTERDRFIREATLAASAAAEDTGATISVAAAVGQACLESNFGRSTPPGSNNILGIKAGKSWNGPTINARTKEQTPAGVPYDTSADWRMYDSWRHCFQDYCELIATRPWYQGALVYPGDPERYLQALMPVYGSDGRVLKSGYATDVNYVDKVLKIIADYQIDDYGADDSTAVLNLPATGSLRLDQCMPAVTRVFVGDLELTGVEAIGIVAAGNGTAKLYIR